MPRGRSGSRAGLARGGPLGLRRGVRRREGADGVAGFRERVAPRAGEMAFEGVDGFIEGNGLPREGRAASSRLISFLEEERKRSSGCSQDWNPLLSTSSDWKMNRIETIHEPRKRATRNIAPAHN